MVEKKLARSSYDDYVEAINKITPHLNTLLAHVTNEEQAAVATAGRKISPRGRVTTRPRPRGLSGRKTLYSACEEQVQAVSNSGHIVYGVLRDDGKIDVRGTVGEVSGDLLGVDSVNAGQTKRARKTTTSTGTRSRRTGSPRHGSPTRTPSRSGTDSTSRRGAPRRRGYAPMGSGDMPVDGIDGME